MRIVKVALSFFPDARTSKVRDFLKKYKIGLVKMGLLIFEILPMLIEYRICKWGIL